MTEPQRSSHRARVLRYGGEADAWMLGRFVCPATRLAELFAAEGLIVEEAYDGWSERPLVRRTTSMTLVARKAGR